MKAYLKKIIVKIIEWEAKVVLRKYKPKIVAVTGNVGKTSTKDAIYTVLSHFFFVRKSEKSFNSDIGVPLTILGLPNAWNNPLKWLLNILEGLKIIILPNHYPKWLVLEVGADRPGDIEKIGSWLHPDVVVITRFSEVPVHIEFFESKDAIVREKGYLVKALKKDGLLILNGDDSDALSLAPHAFIKPITYGFKEGLDIRGSNYNFVYAHEKPVAITFKVDYQGSCMPISLGRVLGVQHIYPALAAIAVGVSQGLNPINVAEALIEHEPPHGRMNLIPGLNNSTIIDDSYNSSPVALDEALTALESAEVTGRKIAALGDMLELGKFSIDEHKRLGKRSANMCDVLVAVGVRGKFFAEAALKARMAKKKVFVFENSVQAGDFLKEYIEEGDIILVKGSQGVRMEKITKQIIAEPERAKELLVRQDEEWERR